MQSVAAYFLMIATENERASKTQTYVSPPIRLSLSARIAKALRGRPRPSRATVGQPA
jgi:hypothetical protein